MKNLYFTLAALLLTLTSFAITGPANVCVSTFTSYSDAAPGGTWSSSAPPVASINMTTGVLQSISAGTTVLTYSNGTTINTFTVTVVNSLPPISATTTSVCVGSSISLSNAVSGGTWASSNTARATVNASGDVTGVSPGTVNIQYKLGGSCTASQSVAVSAVLSGITGATSVCTSNVLSLSNGGATGTWSSNNTNVVVYTQGNVWVFHAGTSTITFTNATSCGAASATHNITIIPGIGPNSWISSVCAGSPTQLSNATAGGTWSSSNTVIATVNTTSGVVTGSTTGFVYIIYTVGGGCTATSSITVTSGFTGFPATGTMCSGTSRTLTSYSGTWTSSNTSVVTISGSGVLYAVAPGTSTVTFVNAGCGMPGATQVVTVVPGVSPTTGVATMCAGSTALLSNATSGGSWSSATSSIATVTTTGLVSAVTAGEAFIVYANSSGCAYVHTVHISSSTVSLTGPSTLCVGNSATVSASLPGGTWSSSNTSLATISAGGTIYPIAAGSVTFTYNYSGGCASGSPTHNVTIIAGVTPTIVPATMCAGTTVVLSNSTPGGTWSSGTTSAATIDPATRIVTALTPGHAAIRYTVGSCFHSATLTVLASPAPLTGVSSVCIGGATQLSSSPAGGTWTGSNTAVATVTPGSGLVSGIGAGTSVISYHLANGCRSSMTVTVGAALTVTANAVQSCNGVYTLTASGATSYSWAPATGLSCATCATTTVNPTTTVNYVITGTSPGCSGTGNLTVNGNLIRGNISYTGTSSDVFRVWLIKYDPTDSTVMGVDSTLTCMAGTTPYYQFNNPVAGSYSVKAKKLGSVPGVSGYIPTYGLASANWFSATTVNHTTNTDYQTINMIYGTVPAGPGFVAGNVYYGAGKGTTGDAPATDMLILLRNAATNVLTYTYTDAAGAYSFNNLAYGDYVIYPEEYDYYTTPSAIITLNATAPSASGINFKQHTDYGTITPFGGTGISDLNNDGTLTLYPNPTANDITLQWTASSAGIADVIVTDITGREVYRTIVDMAMKAGVAPLKLTNLDNGIYMISVRSATINYNNKIEVRH